MIYFQKVNLPSNFINYLRKSTIYLQFNLVYQFRPISQKKEPAHQSMNLTNGPALLFIYFNFTDNVYGSNEALPWRSRTLI